MIIIWKVNKTELPFPTLILLAGVSASGKTTFSNDLAGHIWDIAPIDKDVVNDAFLSTHSQVDRGIFAYRFSGPTIPRNHEYYHTSVKFQSYHALLALARNLLRVGKHPLLDGNYVKEIRQGYIDEIVTPFFQEIPHRRKIIFCYTDEEIIKKRLVERGYARDIDKLESESSWRRYLEEQPILPPELERYNHIKVDTAKSTEFNIRQVLGYLTT